MSPIHLEPIRATEAIAVAREFGFDPLYFLRVIGPADVSYRAALNERIGN